MLLPRYVTGDHYAGDGTRVTRYGMSRVKALWDIAGGREATTAVAQRYVSPSGRAVTCPASSTPTIIRSSPRRRTAESVVSLSSAQP
jgi:hypothetical protein